MSANLAKIIDTEKKLNVPSEDSFLCSLLHSLGKIIICVYLPEVYRKIEKKIADGTAESIAAASVLDSLTYSQVGQEIARFWNFGQSIIETMVDIPPPRETITDPHLQLLHLTVFSNRIIQTICTGKPNELNNCLTGYRKVIPVTHDELVEVVKLSIEMSEEIAPVIKNGIARLRTRSRLIAIADTF